MMASFQEAVQVIERIDQSHLIILFTHSGDSMIRKVALWRLEHSEQEWMDLSHLLEASRVPSIRWSEGADSKLWEVEGVRQVKESRVDK